MNNIYIFYLFRFFQSLIPAYVIERLFWEQRGMTIQLVVYTEIIYALTIILLEVPSGIFADRFGRKRSIVFSALFGCCEFLILLYATTFWHFAAAIFLAGVSYAAASGAENALLYETLAQRKQAHSFEKHLGRLNAGELTATIIAALCGSVLAKQFGFELNYWLSFFSTLICLVTAFLFVEPKKLKTDNKRFTFSQHLAIAMQFFRQKPNVCCVVVVAMITGASLNYIDEFWQLYLEQVNIPIHFFGLFSSSIMFMMLIGNLIADHLKKQFRYQTILLNGMIILTSGFVYISLTHNRSSLIAMLLIYIIAGVMEPLSTGYLHHHIKHEETRATIDSCQSLGTNGLMMTIGLGFGYFSSQINLFGGYGFIAVCCSLCLLGYLFVVQKLTL